MLSYRSIFSIFILFVLSLAVVIPAISRAASTCSDSYSSSVAVPTGYGAAYNPFSSAKELLVKTTSCTDTSASITVGNGDTALYVYKEGYYWTGSAWQKINFTSSNALDGVWYKGQANASVPMAAGNSERFYVGYTCQQVSSVWKCGCSNTTCATPAWQLQKVNKISTAVDPTATFSANPTSITASGNSTLTWTSTNTTGCTGNGFSTGGNTSGSVTVSPTNTTTYTLTCINMAQSVTKSVTVTVGSSGPVCGNGICEAGETTASCSSDCRPAGSANIIINYASAASMGTLNHVAAGLLHGLEDALSNKISPASLWTDLSMNFLRTRPGTVARVYTEDKRLRGGSTDVAMVITLSGSWGYATNPSVTPPWGNNYNAPDYSAWLNYVVTQVNQMKTAVPDANKRIYDLWNEPNGEYWWKTPASEASTYSHFKEMYRLTYKLLKEGLPGYNGGVALDPTARFTAPGTSVGLNNLNETFTTDFMKYAKDNNVVPDLWNWHFGDPKTLERFNTYMNYAASIGAARDAMVLEYLRENDGKRPGRAAYEIALLESATHAGSGKKIIGATDADWPSTGEAGNGLFYSGGTWRKHGIWYIFANYAKMSGAEAPFTSVTTSPKIGAVASINSSSQKAWALLGNDVFDQRWSPSDTATVGNTTIRLDGIRSADSSNKVNVTVSRIPYKNFGEVNDSDITKVINNAEYTVTDNSISVAIPWGLGVDGYFMEVSNVIPR